MSAIRQVALLGLGEVGSILARDLLARGGIALRLWDRQFDNPGSAPSRTRDALLARDGVSATRSAGQAAAGCELVISAVTADQDLAAAASVLPGLPRGCWFLDLNSVAPSTKRSAADLVDAAGGRYVEASVMSPIGPRRIRSPILLAGPHAETFEPLARQLGFAGASFYSAEPGRAAATKMCRSVIVKGMEALVSESLLAARHYGVEEEVLTSLNDLFPLPDWAQHARYLISRTLEHGVRRSEEMREVARTVADAGLDPWMSRACVERQAWAPGFADALSEEELVPMLDRIRTDFTSSMTKGE